MTGLPLDPKPTTSGATTKRVEITLTLKLSEGSLVVTYTSLTGTTFSAAMQLFCSCLRDDLDILSLGGRLVEENEATSSLTIPTAGM